VKHKTLELENERNEYLPQILIQFGISLSFLHCQVAKKILVCGEKSISQCVTIKWYH